MTFNDETEDLAKDRFCAALRTLDLYAQEKHTSRFSLPNLFSLAKRFIVDPSSEKKNSRSEEQVIQYALDEVERFFPFIQHQDHVEENFLAERARQTMALCLKNSRLSSYPSIVERLYRLAHTEISCTKKTTSYADRSHPDILVVDERIKDLFMMKAISAVEGSGVFPFVEQKADWIRKIRKTPIRPVVDMKDKNTALTLEQRLSPLPGETIILRGSFKNGLPLPESFEMTMESIQTGFPDPVQHHGFSSPSCLFPQFPMRPYKIPALVRLLQGKERVQKELSLKGKLFQRSIFLINKKKELAQQNKFDYLSLQEELALSVCLSAPRFLSENETREIIRLFFTWLADHPCVLTTLSLIVREVNKAYVLDPYEAWSEFRLQKTSKGSSEKNHKEALVEAREFLVEKILEAKNKMGQNLKNWESPAMTYSRLLGLIQGRGSVNLLLQYASEVEEWPPPQLSLFEKKMQALVFSQQTAFIEELSSQTSPQFSHMKKSIEQEIAIQKSPISQNRLVDDLERYYLSRFMETLE